MQKLTNLLYVEDEPDIRDLAKMAMEEVGGLTVYTASSGMEAIAMLQSLTPQLVLLDVMMPGLDGPATLAKLKEMPFTASIPVIFMTAKAQVQEVAHLKALGAIGVIPKPFDPMTLSSTIQSLWEVHHGG